MMKDDQMKSMTKLTADHWHRIYLQLRSSNLQTYNKVIQQQLEKLKTTKLAAAKLAAAELAAITKVINKYGPLPKPSHPTDRQLDAFPYTGKVIYANIKFPRSTYQAESSSSTYQAESSSSTYRSKYQTVERTRK
jgi:hypothetical protein